MVADHRLVRLTVLKTSLVVVACMVNSWKWPSGGLSVRRAAEVPSVLAFVAVEAAAAVAAVAAAVVAIAAAVVAVAAAAVGPAFLSWLLLRPWWLQF